MILEQHLGLLAAFMFLRVPHRLAPCRSMEDCLIL